MTRGGNHYRLYLLNDYFISITLGFLSFRNYAFQRHSKQAVLQFCVFNFAIFSDTKAFLKVSFSNTLMNNISVFIPFFSFVVFYRFNRQLSVSITNFNIFLIESQLKLLQYRNDYLFFLRYCKRANLTVF